MGIHGVRPLYSRIAAGVIDIAADPSNLGGLAWLQAGALLLMSLMNTAMIWFITVPIDVAARPLPGRSALTTELHYALL